MKERHLLGASLFLFSSLSSSCELREECIRFFLCMYYLDTLTKSPQLQVLHFLQSSGILGFASFGLYPNQRTTGKHYNSVRHTVILIGDKLDTLTAHLLYPPTEIALHISFQKH